MSWSLSASGHADNPDDERALARRAGQVLKDAGAIVNYASMSSGSYAGDPRELAATGGTAAAADGEAGQ